MADLSEMNTTPEGGQAPPRSLGSEVWNYFTIVTFGDEHKTRCSICKHDLSYTPGITGTSAMRQHLINKHDIQLTSKARNSHNNDTEVPMDDMSLDELIPDGRKGKKSKVWNFFKLIEYGDERYSRCVMCRADLKYHGSTTSMLHHLRAKHYVAFQKGEPPHYSLKAVYEGGEGDASKDGDLDSSMGNEGDLNSSSSSSKKPVSVDSVNRQHRGSTGMGRGKSSVVWKFFKVVYFGADKRTRCDLCGSDMAYHDGTTAMHKHLERKHPKEYAQGDRMPTVGHSGRYSTAGSTMDNMYDDDDVDDEFLVSPAHVNAVLSFMEQTDTNRTQATTRETRSHDNQKPLKVSLNKDTIKSLLKESITNLCRERLQFDIEVSVEALIGVTVDKKEVLLVNINETLVPDEYGSSSRGSKRSSQIPASSAKKKHKKGRGRPPKHSPWSRKDTDVSLQMETYDAADENWEPGGGTYNVKPDRAESSGRTRRARKRVSYREDNENDSDDNMDDNNDDGEFDDADKDYTPEKQVQVKLERLDWNPPTIDQPDETDNKYTETTEQNTYKTENANRVDMSVKSCVICNKIYMATEHLNHHMVVHHGLGLDKGESQEEPGDAQIQGEFPAQERKEQPNTEIKQQGQETEPPVKCRYCGETLQADQAVEHFNTAHPGERIEYERESSDT